MARSTLRTATASPHADHLRASPQRPVERILGQPVCADHHLVDRFHALGLAGQQLDERHLEPPAREQLRQTGPLDVPHDVEDHDARAERGLLSLRPLVVDHEGLLGARNRHRPPLGEAPHRRTPPGRDDHGIGRERQHVVGAGFFPKADLDAPARALALEQQHAVPARRRHPGGFRPGRPAPHHHDLLRRQRRHPGTAPERVLAAHHRIGGAGHRKALEQVSVAALVASGAGADLGGVPGASLLGPALVGDQRAHDGDGVGVAVREDRLGLGRREDAVYRKNGHAAHGLLHRTRRIDTQPVGAVDRAHHAETREPDAHVQEVHQPERFEAGGRLCVHREVGAEDDPIARGVGTQAQGREEPREIHASVSRPTACLPPRRAPGTRPRSHGAGPPGRAPARYRRSAPRTAVPRS